MISSEFRLKIEGLPRITQACAILTLARKKTDDLLKRAGILGILTSILTRKAVDEVLWQIDQRVTPVIDDVENREFMNDLNKFKEECEINNDTSVLYIGSGNDTSVQRIFPQTINIDIHTPRKMPKDYRFVKANTCHLPNIESGTTDAIIFKYFNHCVLEIPAVAQELERILKVNGKVLSIGSNIGDTDFSTEPQSIEETVSQNVSLRILRNLCKGGIKVVRQFPNGTALLEKGKVDDGDKDKFDETYVRNREIFYKLLEELEEGESSTDILMTISQIENALGLSISECRHMDWGYIEQMLQRVKAEAPPKAYRIIEAKIKAFLDRVKK